MQDKEGKKQNIKSIFMGIAAGIANGLFGAGGGSIAVPFMIRLLKIERKKAHATAIAIILPLTAISLFIYSKNGYIDLKKSIWVMVGGTFGGFAGGRLLGKCSDKVLRKVFAVFITAAAVKMIF